MILLDTVIRPKTAAIMKFFLKSTPTKGEIKENNECFECMESEQVG